MSTIEKHNIPFLFQIIGNRQTTPNHISTAHTWESVTIIQSHRTLLISRSSVLDGVPRYSTYSSQTFWLIGGLNIAPEKTLDYLLAPPTLSPFLLLPATTSLQYPVNIQKKGFRDQVTKVTKGGNFLKIFFEIWDSWNMGPIF